MADVLFDRALELVMDAGQTLLENGGEVFRAQQTMEIMAASLGVRDFHVYVLTNGIFASAHLPGRDAVSLVRHVPTVSIHLGRVEAVNELSRELAAGRLGVVEAEARLNTARTLPRSTPQLEILACVVGAAWFAYLFGGTLADMPVAAVAGLLEALVCQQFARHGINRIFTDIVAAFCGSLRRGGVFCLRGVLLLPDPAGQGAGAGDGRYMDFYHSLLCERYPGGCSRGTG